MKKKYSMILVLEIIFGGSALNNLNGETSKKTAPKMQTAVEYSCPMHADVIMTKAGNCPKCGMALVEKKGSKLNKNGY